MMAGIVIFYRLSDSIFVAAVLSVLALTAFILRYYWGGVALFFTLAGFTLSMYDRPQSPPADYNGDKAFWLGEIYDVQSTPAATRLYVKVDASTAVKTFAPFNCALLAPNLPDKYLPGDRIVFKASISSTAALSADLPDEISYSPTFFVDGITASAYVSPDDITVLSSTPSLGRTALSLRSDVVDCIYRSPVESPTAWFLAATLVGDDSMLDRSTVESFRAIGIAHYLALSGFHVGIIAAIASLLFFPLRAFSRAGRLRHIGVIILIWLYTFVCGLSPSLVRASVLITLFLFAKILQRPSSPYNSLCVAAIAILLFSPRQLFAPGFQLSFAAVLSILVFARRINPFPASKRKAHALAEIITVPVSAMAGTSLISIVYFHRFPLLFLIPNVFMGILLPLLLGGGVVLIMATAAGLHFTLLGNLLDFIYSSVDNLCSFLSRFPGCEITGIFLSPPVVAAAMACLILIAVALWRRKAVYAVFAAGVACIAIFVQLTQPSLPQSEIFITRTPLHTDIIARDGSTAVLVSSAPHSEVAYIEKRLRKKYSDYLARRSCADSLIIAPADFSLTDIARRGPYLLYKDRTIYLAFSPDLSEAKNVHIDYLLITRSAGTRPFELVKGLRPDSVIISRDMPSLRASRLIDSCQAASIPVRHLTDKAFSLNS